MFERILKEFGITTNAQVKPFGSGLINNTWLVTDKGKDFILQRINEHVFKTPMDIAANIRLIDDVGKLYPDGSFEVLGRMDGSDLRGCSLLTV